MIEANRKRVNLIRHQGLIRVLTDEMRITGPCACYRNGRMAEILEVFDDAFRRMLRIDDA